MVTKKKEPDLLTEWDDPDSKISSQYGRITYKEWCEKEVMRINRSPSHNVCVRTNENGLVCIGRKVESDA